MSRRRKRGKGKVHTENRKYKEEEDEMTGRTRKDTRVFSKGQPPLLPTPHSPVGIKRGEVWSAQSSRESSDPVREGPRGERRSGGGIKKRDPLTLKKSVKDLDGGVKGERGKQIHEYQAAG